MKIESVQIRNFRKLKNCHIDFGERETVFVGANNSGKTSAISAIVWFLKNNEKFTLKEFTITNWAQINELGDHWLEQNPVDEKWLDSHLWDVISPSLDVWISVDDGEQFRVNHLIPSLSSWDGKKVGVRCQYEPVDVKALYADYKQAKENEEGAKLIISEETDPELIDMAKEELAEAAVRKDELEQELKILLLPKDPMDDKNIIFEIRAGAGGEEAALFANSLFRMYSRFAERHGWKTEILSLDDTGLGGIKEVEFMIQGKGAYSILKHEGGVHRVQRVPETESGGRIHTSTATVAIMPEAEDVDVVIDEKDYRIDVMRASGNGGQCVNTTDSAVRLTHYPSGIVIYSQTEKSQIQNKAKAFALLRAKLYDLELQKQHNELAGNRKSQVGTGDRSEKIRTYNFPQGRVTDHRIKLTLYKIDAVMDGELDEIIDALIAADRAAALASET